MWIRNCPLAVSTTRPETTSEPSNYWPMSPSPVWIYESGAPLWAEISIIREERKSAVIDGCEGTESQCAAPQRPVWGGDPAATPCVARRVKPPTSGTAARS